jgi:hypothetical protein
MVGLNNKHILPGIRGQKNLSPKPYLQGAVNPDRHTPNGFPSSGIIIKTESSQPIGM